MNLVAIALVTKVLGACGDPCIVTDSLGGDVVDFYRAGIAISNGKAPKLVIDGYCNSACMTLAGVARPHVCITPRAKFGYHKTNINRNLPLSIDLADWIDAHDGFPPSDQVKYLPIEVAQKFWPMCKGY